MDSLYLPPKKVQGCIVLSGDPYIVHRSEGCVVWEVDCSSKYAESFLLCGDTSIQWILTAKTDTLKLGAVNGPTVLSWSGAFEDIFTFEEGGRYSHRVGFYKRTDDDLENIDD